MQNQTLCIFLSFTFNKVSISILGLFAFFGNSMDRRNHDFNNLCFAKRLKLKINR